MLALILAVLAAVCLLLGFLHAISLVLGIGLAVVCLLAALALGGAFGAWRA